MFCHEFFQAVVHSVAGRQLHGIETIGDIVSLPVLAGLWLLVVFALLPVIYDLFTNAGRKTGGMH